MLVNAIALRDDVDMFLETAGAVGDVEAEAVDASLLGDAGAGAEESKGGDAGDGGAEESKGGDDDGAGAGAQPPSALTTPATAPAPRVKEALTPFLRDVERALLTLHAQRQHGGGGASSSGGAGDAGTPPDRGLLALATGGAENALARFSRVVGTAGGDPAAVASSLASLTADPGHEGPQAVVGAAVRLLTALQRKRLEAVCQPDGEQAVVTKKKKYGPLETCTR